MAKKSRRTRRRSTAKRVTGVTTGAPPQEAADNRASKPGVSTAAHLGGQYAYVYDDLKRIAVIAGALFVVLIGLSFVIR